MYKFFVIALVSAAAFFCANANAQKTPLKPGLWEVTTTNQVPKKDAKQISTSRFCYAAADTDSLQRVLPPQGDFGAKCTTRDVKLDGEKAKWQLSCTGKSGTLSGPSSIVFGADSYEGAANLTAQSAGKTTKLTQTIVGKRISGC
jgi:Protein of unknown function (DUF3617)